MKNEEKVKLEPKLVSNISGRFYIPSYQRGYRWENDQIVKLLDDVLENGDQNYCLQPIVVKVMENDRFELIDGQQRLTTLFLIMKYMKQVLPMIESKFSIEYQTRERSAEFLESLDEKTANAMINDNIDFYHMRKAYLSISAWFDDLRKGEKNLKVINLYKYFGEKVKVIWYEVRHNENSIDLFTRLNIGKIPLTNAELVKALFLSRDNNEINEEKQIEIATGWDIIEKELHDENFWAFLTNDPPEKYATRIELLFDMMANKKVGEREKFFTFYYFSERMKAARKTDLWNEIQRYFLLVKEWHENRDVYHKVGYLVAVGEKLQSIINDSMERTKSVFISELDTKIKNRLNLDKEKISELSYENKNDKAKIENLLLLFNVETVRLLKNSFDRYSFEVHKRKGWSLEHIHAQQSEGLNKKEDQQEWLLLHKESLFNLKNNSDKKTLIEDVIKKIDSNYHNITREIFEDIFMEVINLLSENKDNDYLHLIPNLALLSSADNAALNNSTFDVKRNKILEMDKNGEYIPICTKRVFFKYYTKSEDHQLHFWGKKDRDAYLEAMVGGEGILLKYLN
jgi:hypothetical protein